MSLNDQFKQQSEALSGFKKQSAQSGDMVSGVSVPVSIDRDGAKLRAYIHLNPAVLESPEAFNSVLNELEQMFDLDTWQPRGGSSGGGFKNNGGGYNNRYNNNGGGYRR